MTDLGFPCVCVASSKNNAITWGGGMCRYVHDTTDFKPSVGPRAISDRILPLFVLPGMLIVPSWQAFQALDYDLRYTQFDEEH